MLNGVTFTRYLIEEQRRIPGATGDFTSLVCDIATACKEISHAVNRGRLIRVLGSTDSRDIQGEIQQKLDSVANEIMITGVEWTGHLAGLVSEELADLFPIPAGYPRGKYLLLFDPLDGSANSEINVSVGTIFSVLRCPETVTELKPEHVLQPGVRQVCAGYAMYGPFTMLVFTSGHGVNGFTLDKNVGEFILTHPNMRIPADTREFAVNMSNQRFWEPPVQRYVQECLEGADGVRRKNFNMRWIATMVAEVHRLLNRGGLFMYPWDRREPRQPGHLRLLYEANPMAFIVEQAGGAASTGRERLLTVQPTALHQRVPVILGARHEVERLASYHQSS